MKETQALTHQNGGAAATYDPNFDAQQRALLYHDDGVPVGLEDMAGEQFGLPSLFIVQQQEQAKELGAPLGSLYHSGTQTHDTSMDVIVLGIVKGRVWLDDYDKKNTDEAVLCRSTNGLTPDPKYVREGKAPCQSCAVCPKAQWDRNKDTPPECSEQYKVMTVTAEGGVPGVFYAKSTAASPVKNFAKGFVWSKQPTFGYVTGISTKAKDNYHIPVFQLLKDRPVPIEQQIELAEMAKAFRAHLLEIRDDEAEGEPAPEPAPAAKPATKPAPAARPAPAAKAAPAAEPADAPEDGDPF